MAKAMRIPKGAAGLSVRKGGCRVVEGNIKICVRKNGQVVITQGYGRGGKKTTRKAGPAKRKPAAKKTTKKNGGKRKKVCQSAYFNKRQKGKPVCGCLVMGASGEPVFQPMKKISCTGAKTFSLDSAKKMWTIGHADIMAPAYGPQRPPTPAARKRALEGRKERAAKARAKGFKPRFAGLGRRKRRSARRRRRY